MPKLSAGLMLYRRTQARVQVLLVHPGGPFWAKRDDNVWSLPKGEYGPAEDPWATAVREFREELGIEPPVDAPVTFLGEARQASGKRVCAWALEADLDVGAIRSNTFALEWPPRSGVLQDFPEIDRAAWFDLDEARRKLLPGQVSLLDRLETCLGQAGCR